MKTIVSLVVLPAACVALLGARAFSQGAPAPADSAKRVPVVLELFTSEGCSSCPPADAFLAALAEKQPIAGAQIIAMEEHVDYWNQQGWVDPYSSPQWTSRQQAYAEGFTDHGVYTPELVIDGRGGLVGSHQNDAVRAIASAVAQPQTEISVSVRKAEKQGHAQIQVELGKLQGAQAGDTAEVWLAATEASLQTAVSGGENAGHELHHAPVLRWLHKAGAASGNASPSFSGSADLKLDSAWKASNVRVVAFVQEKRSRRILGAATTGLEP